MKTQEIAIITLTCVASVLAGCDRSTSAEADVVDRATSAAPVMTSTIPTPEPRETKARKTDAPVGEKSPELMPTEPEAAEAELQETEKIEPPVDKLFEADLTSFGGLTLVRFVTAASIVNREPELPASSFVPADERVYAFVETKNEAEVPKTLLVHFIGPDESVSGGIELEIPPSVPRWRTWAYTRHAKAPGLWRVEIRDVDGTLLGALPFEVEVPQ